MNRVWDAALTSVRMQRRGGGHFLGVLPPLSTQQLGDTVGLVLELHAVVVGARLRVPMRGQCVSVGWLQVTTQVRVYAIWLKVGDGVTTGAE